MQPSSQTASISMPPSSGGIERPRHIEDRAYQAVTVATILLFLGSLWVF